MNEWIANHRPTMAGEYLVTLEAETETGGILRWVDTRYYAPPGEDASWAMEGESPRDYHWTVETGSFPHERVTAWMHKPEPYVP